MNPKDSFDQIEFVGKLAKWLLIFAVISTILSFLSIIFNPSFSQTIYWNYLRWITRWSILLSLILGAITFYFKRNQKSKDTSLKNRDLNETSIPIPPSGYQNQGAESKLRKFIFRIYLLYTIIGISALSFGKEAVYQMTGFFILLPAGYLTFHMWLETHRAEKSPLWFYIILLIIITLIASPFLLMMLPR